jgi:hypothetical protein
MEMSMANLSISIPDPMKEFVDREIGSGRFKDVYWFSRNWKIAFLGLAG